MPPRPPVTPSKIFAPATAHVPGGKVGMTQIPPRGTASMPEPQAVTGAGANRAQIYTYLTGASGTFPLYNGDRLWARVTLVLETSGPVAVGTSENITPVLSGKGQLLETDVPMSYTIARGSRIYIAATAVNRVKVTIEALPWLEQITGTLGAIADGLSNLFSRLGPKKA